MWSLQKTHIKNRQTHIIWWPKIWYYPKQANRNFEDLGDSSTWGIQAGAPKSLKHNSPCSFSLWTLEIPRHMEILQRILDDMPWMCGGCNSYLQTFGSFVVYVSFFMMLNDIILGVRCIPGTSPKGDWKLRLSDLCALEMMEFHCHFNVQNGIKTGYYCRQTPAFFG